MNDSTLKKIATVLVVILFFMPLIGTLLLSVGASPDTKQYGGLQLILMGVYNIPFLLASLVFLIIGNLSLKKQKERFSIITFAISIASSLVGIIIMSVWAFGWF